MTGAARAPTPMRPMTADDRTPEWLRALGIGRGQWFLMPKPPLERLMTCSTTPEHVKVWACGMLHTFSYQGERAFKLASGQRVPLTPSDIGHETGLSHQHVRRALAQLERDGLAYRMLRDGRSLNELDRETRRQLKGRVEICFYAQPHDPQKSHPTGKSNSRTAWMLGRMGIRAESDFADNAESEQVITRLYTEFQDDVSKLKSEYGDRVQAAIDIAGTGYLKWPAPARRITATPHKTNGLTPPERKGKKRREKQSVREHQTLGSSPPEIRSPDIEPCGFISECVGGFGALEGPDTDSPTHPEKQNPNLNPKEAELTEMASGKLTRKLGKALRPDSPGDLTIIQTAARNLGEATLEQLAARIDARLADITSYAMLLLLATDCAGSTQEWTTGDAVPPPKSSITQRRKAAETEWLRRTEGDPHDND